MTSLTKEEIISSLPLFRNLPQNAVKIIAETVREIKLPEKRVFIEQGNNSGEIFFITKGSVRVYRLTEEGEEVTLAICGPGEILGEMAFLDEQPRSASVETMQPTDVFVLNRISFKQILLNHPDIALSLLKVLSARLRKTGEQMKDLFSKNLEERTWKALKTLSGYFPGSGITLSHEELAEIIGATRARVTEMLDKLQKEGKIILSHRKIRIK
ncbi:Crp/Fnr family transcriptional regulator [Candidatus Daviesbacteria bacterium]|nr:Crp/Fnr family transcriptional regulator [Candidatus Daviesbacteria bacterium]